MTKTDIKGDWNIIRGHLQQRWADLTDDDLRYFKGKSDELIGRIQKRTGETREAIETAIQDAGSYFSSIKLPALPGCRGANCTNNWINLGLWIGATAAIIGISAYTIAALSRSPRD